MLFTNTKRILYGIAFSYIAHKKRKLSIGKVKYFCIGRNKTGTTSLKQAFEDLNYPVGNQTIAEKLYDRYYFQNNFKPIIDYCQSAQIFQDVPFSCPETFKYLDKAYPNSKFILTVRSSPEQWYRSTTRFHAKKFGLNGQIPTSRDLKNAFYIRKGFPYNTVKLHGTTDAAPYDKEIMIRHYNKHNREILTYFKDRPKDLLVLNLEEKDSYLKFIEFLGINSPYTTFPWLNKT